MGPLGIKFGRPFRPLVLGLVVLGRLAGMSAGSILHSSLVCFDLREAGKENEFLGLGSISMSLSLSKPLDREVGVTPFMPCLT